MRLDGRRESSNVEDRRKSSTKKAGVSIGSLLLVGVIAYFTSGGNWGKVATEVISKAMTSQTTQVDSNYQPTAEEEELATFTKQILAGTEDVWAAEFKKLGRRYEAPKLVLFHGGVASGCGNATSSTGPFYCSGDQTVYIDLEFFTTMKQQLGSAGDFAYAYVIAHEVGHHVQYLLGTLNAAHQQMSRMSEKDANQISVSLEVQADFYAGLWAYSDNKMFNSLEAGDLEEGLEIASRIGDDYLQKKSMGYTVPESFNHGTSEQRSRWLKKGFTTGNINDGDTFSQPYSSL